MISFFPPLLLSFLAGPWLPATPLQEEADHQALRAIKSLYEDAIQSNNLEKLRPHVADDFSGIMVTNEAVEGMEEMKKYWDQIKKLMGEGGSYTVIVEPERSWIHGDLALAKGSTQDLVKTGSGTEYTFQSRWTALLQKENGTWKLLRIHGSMDPLKNAFVLAEIRATRWLAGGIMLAVGLLVGWLIRGRIGRKAPG